MNIIDLLIILLAGVFVWRGYELGIIRQASSIIGFVLGLLLGNWFAQMLDSSLAVAALIILLCVALMAGLSELVGLKLRKAIHGNPLGHADKWLGMAGGLIVCGLIVWIGSIILPSVLPPGQGHLVRDSKIIGLLDQNLPPVTDVMAALDDALSERGVLGDFGSNLGVNPDDGPLPAASEFDGVIRTSGASVLRIEGRSCSGIGTGSGFVSDAGLVITNAHVVAGMRYPFVETRDGQRLRATVAHFDSSLDLAILRVSGLTAEPLAFVGNAPVAGDEGIVLGYPGGGPFTAEPGRVLERFTAISRDIYGDQETRRTVFGLHADVAPGNSGGPMLSRSGEVMGVIFARSTTTDQVGYMLENTAVQDALEDARTATYQGTAHLRCAPAS